MVNHNHFINATSWSWASPYPQKSRCADYSQQRVQFRKLLNCISDERGGDLVHLFHLRMYSVEGRERADWARDCWRNSAWLVMWKKQRETKKSRVSQPLRSKSYTRPVLQAILQKMTVLNLFQSDIFEFELPYWIDYHFISPTRRGEENPKSKKLK